MAGQPMLDEYSDGMNNVKIAAADIHWIFVGHQLNAQCFCSGRELTIRLLGPFDRLSNGCDFIVVCDAICNSMSRSFNVFAS